MPKSKIGGGGGGGGNGRMWTSLVMISLTANYYIN